MNPLLDVALTAWRVHWAKLRAARADDAGVFSMEIAIAAFILGGLALTILGIIVYKAVTKANAIPTE